MSFGSKLAPVPADFSIGKVSNLNIFLLQNVFFMQVIQWTVIESENDDYILGNVATERRRKPVAVTLTRNHTSDFVEHQSLLMRFDFQSKKADQRDGIYWSHLSYINISTKKILLEFSRRSTLPQKFEDCTVNFLLRFISSLNLFLDRFNCPRCYSKYFRVRPLHRFTKYNYRFCST